MQGVCARKVQASCWIVQLQQLPGLLELACAEYSVDQLHMQCWLVGVEWRRMHGVCRRQVQCGRRRRLQELPGEFELTCAEHSFEQLHLQRGLVGG